MRPSYNWYEEIPTFKGWHFQNSSFKISSFEHRNSGGPSSKGLGFEYPSFEGSHFEYTNFRCSSFNSQKIGCHPCFGELNLDFNLSNECGWNHESFARSRHKLRQTQFGGLVLISFELDSKTTLIHVLGLKRLTSKSIIHTNLHKPNNKLVNA